MADSEHHRAPRHDRPHRRARADADAPRHAHGHGVIALRHLPQFRDGRDDGATGILGRIRAIEPPALQEDDRRFGARCLDQHPLRVIGRAGAERDQSRNAGEPIFAGMRMPERATARAGIRNRAAAAAARLRADQHRAIPVAVGLIEDTCRQPQRLRHGLMIIHELNLAATRPASHHGRSRRDAKDHLLVQRAADGGTGEFIHQQLRRAKDAATRAAAILPIDEKSRVAPGDFHQRFVDRLQHADLARSCRSVPPARPWARHTDVAASDRRTAPAR